MEVSIIENESGKIIANYTIHLNGLNYVPSEDEYYSEAWKCAIDDGVAEPDKRDKYSFSMKRGSKHV